MHSLASLAVELKCTSNELNEYFLRTVKRKFRLNQRINDNLVDKAILFFNHLKQLDGSYFEGFETNMFLRPLAQPIIYKDQNVITYFTDEQVKNICLKAANSNTREIAKNFYPNATNEANNHYRFVLHKKCVDTLKRYGGFLLTFIYNVDFVTPSNFKPIQAEYINSFFPELFFISNNKRYYMQFVGENEDDNHSSGFTIYDYNHKRILRTNHLGVVSDVFENDIINFRVFIGYLYENSKSGRKLIFGFSGSYSNCDICGRELTQPESILFGRGPDCRNEFGNIEF